MSMQSWKDSCNGCRQIWLFPWPAWSLHIPWMLRVQCRERNHRGVYVFKTLQHILILLYFRQQFWRGDNVCEHTDLPVWWKPFHTLWIDFFVFSNWAKTSYGLTAPWHQRTPEECVHQQFDCTCMCERYASGQMSEYFGTQSGVKTDCDIPYSFINEELQTALYILDKTLSVGAKEPRMQWGMTLLSAHSTASEFMKFMIAKRSICTEYFMCIAWIHICFCYLLLIPDLLVRENLSCMLYPARVS